MRDSASAAAPKFHGLQYLRALAALMVALLHTAQQIPAYTADLECPRMGTGVDLFFVISGFIMAVTGARLSAGEFLKRRLMRIVPLYWLLTSVLAAQAILQPQLFRTTVVTAQTYLLSLLFVPFHNPGHGGDLKPLLVPGWSLNYEMFFYALFALVLWLKPQRMTLLCCGLLGLLAALGNVLPSFYTQPLILEFGLGILVAHIYPHLRLSAGASAALAAGGFAALLSNDFAPLQMLGASAVVLGTVCWERSGALPRWRPGVLLGDASYSLYLLHIFVLGITRVMWSHVFHDRGGAWGAAGFALLSILALTLAALACFRWIETPLSASLRALWPGPRQPLPLPGAARRGSRLRSPLHWVREQAVAVFRRASVGHSRL